MAEYVGPKHMSHQVNGLVKGGCSATLETPDGRQLKCVFPADELNKLNDSHFMTGMINAKLDTDDRDALNADEIWTGMKTNSCEFVE